jgi:hypothetical protein
VHPAISELFFFWEPKLQTARTLLERQIWHALFRQITFKSIVPSIPNRQERLRLFRRKRLNLFFRTWIKE